MLGNFKKRPKRDERQRYQRYDDIFINRPQHDRQQANQNRDPYSEFQRNDQYRDYRRYSQEENIDDYVPPKSSDQFYPQSSDMRRISDISDDNRIRFQKMQLPPLQRYTPNLKDNVYPDMNRSYWDDEQVEQRYSYQGRYATVGDIWQKFFITFGVIIGLVGITWGVYSFIASDQNQSKPNGPVVITPEHPSFKVFPENPVSSEINNKDKTVYNVIDKGMSSLIPENENVLSAQEDTMQLPQIATNNNIEEYTIIDDKIYYIKLSVGESIQALENEVKLLKTKHKDFIDSKNCKIKKVSNSRGEKAYAILVGPFQNQDSAIEVAKEIGIKCSVISVRNK